MKIEKIKYSLNDNELPILKKLHKLFTDKNGCYDDSDRRTKFFPDDYKKQIENRKYMSSACHKNYVPEKYWLQEVEKKCDFVTFTRFFRYSWFKNELSRLEFTSNNLISIKQEKLLLDALTEVAEDMLRTKIIEFDLSNLEAYKYALELDGLKVFDSWLMGQILCQTKGRVEAFPQPIKNENGIYSFEFLIETDEKEAQRYVIDFVNRNMIGYLKQDILNIPIVDDDY